MALEPKLHMANTNPNLKSAPILTKNGSRKWIFLQFRLNKGKSEWPPAGHLSVGSGRYGCQSTSIMEAYHWSKGKPQLNFQS